MTGEAHAVSTLGPTAARPRVLLFATKLGYQTRGFEEAARGLGVDLVYVTDRCHELSDPWGDGAIPVHFENADQAAYAVVEAFRTQRLAGILALGDRPTLAAAYAARGLGHSHNHPASVEACRSKFRMREVFREAGLRTPAFHSLPLNPIPEPALLGVRYPCVLKPLSLSAGQGVIRANSREEFLTAAQQIKRLLDSPEIRSKREANLDQLLVEDYIPGKEVAVEGLVTEGRLQLLAMFDKPDPLEGPYFEETTYVTPSRLSDGLHDQVARCAIEAVRALGLTHGPVHAEFRVNEQGVWPLEIAPRPIGGLCARALRFKMSGEEASITLEELLLRHALGRSCENAAREQTASAVMMIPVPQSGVLQAVEGLAQAQSISGITEIIITARLNDHIAAWPEGSSYLGFIFAKADSPEAAESALRAAHAQLRFSIAARLPVEHPVTRKFHEPSN